MPARVLDFYSIGSSPIALADAVEWPAQPIQAWLPSLAEPLARYDNAVASRELG